MIHIILNGALGKMGRAITSCVAERKDTQIVAGVDIAAEETAAFPVFANMDDCLIPADVMIDFSHPSALTPVLSYATIHHMPAVIATTGLSETQIREIKAAAEKIPVFWSGNMSLGINLVLELAKKAAAVLEGFDIEIVEAHHNQKIDAPSGTAYMIAEAITGTLPEPHKYEYDRHSRRAKRGANEIGIHSVRGGTIVGEHEIIFAGRDELVKISHSAHSKEIFAVGAVNAALFIIGRPAGLYGMSDLMAQG